MLISRFFQKMSNNRSPLLWLFAALFMAALTIASLSLNAIPITIETKDSALSISLLDKKVSTPLSTLPELWEVRLRSVLRYATPDCLVDQSLNKVLVGFKIIKCLFEPRLETPNPYLCKAPTCTFVYFNPFQTRIMIHSPSQKFELGVDTTNGEIALLQNEAKLSFFQSNDHYLRYTIFLLVPSFLAALFCICLIKIFTALFFEFDTGEGISANSSPGGLILFGIFLLGSFLIYWIHLSAFKQNPGFGDEMNYLFQGKIFATGNMAYPEGPNSEFFRVDWMDLFGKDGKIWDFHPPGNSLLLAIGWLIGCYWITVPIIGGCIALSQFLLGIEIFNSKKAAFGYLLLFFSAHYTLSLTSSFMAHPPSLLFLSLAFLGFIRFDKRNEAIDLYVFALCLGIAFTIRPVSAALMGFFPGLIIIKRQLFNSPQKLLFAGCFFAIPASYIFLYTYFITGEFNFPYLVKGPEVGQTFMARLSKGFDEQCRSLYRNVNEFAHRAHSFGFILNLVPFFISFFSRRPFFTLIQVTFIFYVLGHSALHWYGWKWEPRMLYDVSFLFYLSSFEGLRLLYGGLRRHFAARWLFSASATVLVGFLVFVDLPQRFKTEYRNYNTSPEGVRKFIKENNLNDAIFFFENDIAYSSYFPFNTVRFDGGVIYALAQGGNKDASLISQFPTKRVFYTKNGEQITEMKSFFKQDYDKLIAWGSLLPNRSTYFVLPWKKFISAEKRAAFNGTIIDIAHSLTELPSITKRVSSKEKITMVLVGESIQIEYILENIFTLMPISIEGYETPVKAYTLAGIKMNAIKEIPGFSLKCFDNIRWEGVSYLKTFVPNVDIDLCPGQNQGLEWNSNIRVEKDMDVTLYTESDDGSGILIDDKVVLDNGLNFPHGKLRLNQTVHLTKGTHTIKIRYFNGPAQAYFQAGIRSSTGENIPLTVRPNPDISFWVDFDTK